MYRLHTSLFGFRSLSIAAAATLERRRTFTDCVCSHDVLERHASADSRVLSRNDAAALQYIGGALHHQRRKFHCNFHEPITPELITVEMVSCSEASASLSVDGGDKEGDDVINAAAASTSRGEAASASAHSSSSLFTIVSAVDVFAKGKVSNYLRRMGAKDSSLFSICREEDVVTRREVVRARVKLILPAPHGGMFVGEGVSDNEKDAESLAAMHAEHIMDALGVPLFRLSSMQVKHAEAAKRQNRYAPMPGDPVKPEGTAVPSPFRMVVGYGESQSKAEHLHRGDSNGRLFRTVMEGEVVDSTVSSKDRVPSSHPDGADFEADSQSLGGDRPASSSKRHEYATTCFIPWGSQDIDVAVVSPASSATTTGTHGAMFDPTENGLFQMVNVASTRMSPSKDAVLFPCVFDAAAYDRLTDYYLGHGKSIKSCVQVSHVAVPGFSVRMHLAEFRLAGEAGALVARGKAQDKDVAIQLAAMHAELLIDAVGQALFPTDAARQARHSDAVRSFGRWAVHPNIPRAADLLAPEDTAPLPVALKQQVGGDDVWLDPASVSRRHRRQTYGERVISAHFEYNNMINEFVEVNPPANLLADARKRIQRWQRDVACNSLLDAFVITKMGDFYRASTILPVPKSLGLRGGNGIGRSVEQAVELASLHALDTLAALGLPLSPDAAEDAELVALRSAAGLVTAAKAAKYGFGGTTSTVEQRDEKENSKQANPVSDVKPRYLPGYIIEGSNVRDVPRVEDLLHALTLKTTGAATTADQQELLVPQESKAASSSAQLGDFDIVEGLSEVDIINNGNNDRSNLQMYLQRVAKKATMETNVFISGYARNQSVYNVAFMEVPLPLEHVSMPGKSPVVPEGAAAVLPLPPKLDAASASPNSQDYRVLAVGCALKKKDAERMCFVHAARILRAFGIDVAHEKDILVWEKKSRVTHTPSSSSSSSKKKLSAAAQTSASTQSSNAQNHQSSQDKDPSAASAAPCATKTPESLADIPSWRSRLPRPVMHPNFKQQLMTNAKLVANAQAFKAKQRRSSIL